MHSKSLFHISKQLEYKGLGRQDAYLKKSYYHWHDIQISPASTVKVNACSSWLCILNSLVVQQCSDIQRSRSKVLAVRERHKHRHGIADDWNAYLSPVVKFANVKFAEDPDAWGQGEFTRLTTSLRSTSWDSQLIVYIDGKDDGNSSFTIEHR